MTYPLSPYYAKTYAGIIDSNLYSQRSIYSNRAVSKPFCFYAHILMSISKDKSQHSMEYY